MTCFCVHAANTGPPQPPDSGKGRRAAPVRDVRPDAQRSESATTGRWSEPGLSFLAFGLSVMEGVLPSFLDPAEADFTASTRAVDTRMRAMSSPRPWQTREYQSSSGINGSTFQSLVASPLSGVLWPLVPISEPQGRGGSGWSGPGSRHLGHLPPRRRAWLRRQDCRSSTGMPSQRPRQRVGIGRSDGHVIGRGGSGGWIGGSRDRVDAMKSCPRRWPCQLGRCARIMTAVRLSVATVILQLVQRSTA